MIRAGSSMGGKIIGNLASFYLCRGVCACRKGNSRSPGKRRSFASGRKWFLITWSVRMKLLLANLLAVMTMVLVLGNNHAGDKKITIKQVMKEAHQGKVSLLKKVADGNA